MAANHNNSNGADTVDGVGSPAKSNLKKKAENENNSALASANNLHHSSDQTNNDKKKVQFNKFATVQMMEIWIFKSDTSKWPNEKIDLKVKFKIDLYIHINYYSSSYPKLDFIQEFYSSQNF